MIAIWFVGVRARRLLGQVVETICIGVFSLIDRSVGIEAIGDFETIEETVAVGVRTRWIQALSDFVAIQQTVIVSVWIEGIQPPLLVPRDRAAVGVGRQDVHVPVAVHVRGEYGLRPKRISGDDPGGSKAAGAIDIFVPHDLAEE